MPAPEALRQALREMLHDARLDATPLPGTDLRLWLIAADRRLQVLRATTWPDLGEPEEFSHVSLYQAGSLTPLAAAVPARAGA